MIITFNYHFGGQPFPYEVDGDDVAEEISGLPEFYEDFPDIDAYDDKEIMDFIRGSLGMLTRMYRTQLDSIYFDSAYNAYHNTHLGENLKFRSKRLCEGYDAIDLARFNAVRDAVILMRKHPEWESWSPSLIADYCMRNIHYESSGIFVTNDDNDDVERLTESYKTKHPENRWPFLYYFDDVEIPTTGRRSWETGEYLDNYNASGDYEYYPSMEDLMDYILDSEITDKMIAEDCANPESIFYTDYIKILSSHPDISLAEVADELRMSGDPRVETFMENNIEEAIDRLDRQEYEKLKKIFADDAREEYVEETLRGRPWESNQ